MDQAHPTIAIVEDERILRDELAFQLTHLGFAVETFETAAQLYRRLAVCRYAVVVLDIGLADEDGLSICRYLRRHDKQLGLVFITARTTRDDRLIGLQAGGDAYLTKPVDIDELALLLRRLAERAGDALGWPAPPSPFQPPSGWRLEPGGDVLHAPDGARIRLSLNEARLLQRLLHRPDEVVTSQELARTLGLLPDEYDKHRLEVIISRLRDKVLRETGQTLPLRARRGLGYRFVPSD
jgi:two-component system, OmpR family, response regulator PhoP